MTAPTTGEVTDETITDEQAEFLADLGDIGREMCAPNPKVRAALRERGLISCRFIGMGWWCQPTESGRASLAAWNARHGGSR